ncbi:M13 family metallopeptidase [Chromobacterium haemolyticum]|uniref:M13 family metallopeptidase n=1 Tax=Chromobacterium haemolyticum TaxID=394935 RepID=UPI00405571DE
MKMNRLLPLAAWLCAAGAWADSGLDYGRYGIDLNGIDPAVRVQDNLSLHANGGWLKHAEIPAERSSIGVAEVLAERNLERLRQLIEQAGQGADVGKEASQIAALYRSFMDEDTIAHRGLEPLRESLRAVAGLNSTEEAVRYMGRLQDQPVDTPFRFYVSQDPKDSAVYLAGVGQSGLAMDQDYYLGKSADFAAARQAYLKYLERLFEQAELDQPQSRARDVLAFETRLAKIQWTNVENRDIQKTYNKLSLAELARRQPGYDWSALLSDAGLGAAKQLNLDQPGYLSKLAPLLRTTSAATLRNYLLARTLDAYAPSLTPAFVDAHFDFYGKTLEGRKQNRPRWKRGVSVVESGLGEALGKLYVARYFTPEAKRQADELVRNLLKAYDQSIDTLDWMSEATKRQAHVKLSKYALKIGYPDKWRNYEGLELSPDDLAGNARRIASFNYQYMIGKLGQPVDRKEWSMTPQTVNAYYNPANNEIVFPAAILQAPYFDPGFDPAVNYGSIGATIGHEISHGFDDQGSQFDGDGNMRNWWTSTDNARFKAATRKLVKQYGRYQPVPGHYVNGELTLGENIADNAGLEVAYKAYHLALGGKEAPVLDGMSGDQRFFIAFAQSWRSKTRDEATLKQLVSDPHTPDLWRPIGTASNMEPFYQAFDVKPGDKMHLPPKQRFHLWW